MLSFPPLAAEAASQSLNLGSSFGVDRYAAGLYYLWRDSLGISVRLSSRFLLCMKDDNIMQFSITAGAVVTSTTPFLDAKPG
jgi:hypothetical protein